MIVWITHAKVGHRQTPYKQQRPSINGGAFLFYSNLKLCDVHLPYQQNTEYTQYGNLIRPVTRPGWTCPMDAAVKRIAPQAQCYQRRRPEKTLWYRTVQTHFE
jgi:hypothetical protein